MNVLFICSRNRLRSPTAEAVFAAHPGIEVASAGTNSDAANVISADLVEWADVIFAMEAVHKRRLHDKFSPLLRNRRVIVLGIPDKYEYMDQALVAALKKKVTRHLQVPIHRS
jgi:predicted protein tyrosine phosphatase